SCLFNHDGGSHRLTINRNQSADTASVLFQTDFSGRAEFGLAGDDAWRVKLSADGNDWTVVLAAHASGLTELGGPLRLAPYRLLELPDPAEAGPGAMVHVMDEAGGAMPAYSDGSAWRRLTDGG